MDARGYFLSRRHRVGIVVGNGVGLLIVGIELGMVFAHGTLRPEGRIDTPGLVLGLLCLGLLFPSFVRRIQWLDSAVVEQAPKSEVSEAAV
jgi:hypothetical protein